MSRQLAGKRVMNDDRLAFGPNELTDNEIVWVEFLRIRPTLRRIQLLRRACGVK